MLYSKRTKFTKSFCTSSGTALAATTVRRFISLHLLSKNRDKRWKSEDIEKKIAKCLTYEILLILETDGGEFTVGIFSNHASKHTCERDLKCALAEFNAHISFKKGWQPIFEQFLNCDKQKIRFFGKATSLDETLTIVNKQKEVGKREAELKKNSKKEFKVRFTRFSLLGLLGRAILWSLIFHLLFMLFQLELSPLFALLYAEISDLYDKIYDFLSSVLPEKVIEQLPRSKKKREEDESLFALIKGIAKKIASFLFGEGGSLVGIAKKIVSFWWLVEKSLCSFVKGIYSFLWGGWGSLVGIAKKIASFLWGGR